MAIVLSCCNVYRVLPLSKSVESVYKMLLYIDLLSSCFFLPLDWIAYSHVSCISRTPVFRGWNDFEQNTYIIIIIIIILTASGGAGRGGSRSYVSYQGIQCSRLCLCLCSFLFRLLFFWNNRAEGMREEGSNTIITYCTILIYTFNFDSIPAYYTLSVYINSKWVILRVFKWCPVMADSDAFSI
jgi:hypothetical protein